MQKVESEHPLWLWQTDDWLGWKSWNHGWNSWKRWIATETYLRTNKLAAFFNYIRTFKPLTGERFPRVLAIALRFVLCNVSGKWYYFYKQDFKPFFPRLSRISRDLTLLRLSAILDASCITHRYAKNIKE